MKKMKNFGTLIATSLICVCTVGGSVLAEDGEYNRSSRIASKGVFEYSNNAVVLDSSDLIYLANEIDDLEREYKSATMEALNRISTFYASTDGDISHDYDDNNVSSDTAAELSFNDLYQGILKSQSVDHLANVQAKDAEDNPLYYADQNASESNDLITTTTNSTGYPLFIQPATSNNLTAGTAAWVDGDLMIGTGADNTAYYDKGYNDKVKELSTSGKYTWCTNDGDITFTKGTWSVMLCSLIHGNDVDASHNLTIKSGEGTIQSLGTIVSLRITDDHESNESNTSVTQYYVTITSDNAVLTPSFTYHTHLYNKFLKSVVRCKLD